MKTFEYLTRSYIETFDFTVPPSCKEHHCTAEQLFEKDANALGTEGWELVAINPKRGGSEFSAIFMKDTSPLMIYETTEDKPTKAKRTKKWSPSVLPTEDPGITITIGDTVKQSGTNVEPCDCTPGTKTCGRNDCTSEPKAGS